jgi:death-on-curing protein
LREPKWVDRLVVDAIHLDQVREHGGLVGVRDENAFEAALARSRQKWDYEPRSDLATLAAAYAFGLSRSHPFHDGNKRVAFIVMVVFLELNGKRFQADEAGAVLAMVALADGSLSEKDLAIWIRKNSTKPKRR